MAAFAPVPAHSWTRSPHIEKVVFVNNHDIPCDAPEREMNCRYCAFQHERAEVFRPTHPHLFDDATPCSHHGCTAGVWVGETTAISWKLEQ